MIAAKLHPLESERLEALHDLKILDTNRESEFQDIVELASLICGTPISLISLIDKERQWFKAAVGLEATETPRDLAFCAHAILQDAVFEVQDTTLDERFADNPLVTNAPNVMFYAGAPLLAPNQMPIGTLCVADNKPRKLEPVQQRALEQLSKQITRVLELRMQNLDLTKSIRELAFHKTALSGITDGVVMQDAAGQIQNFNAAALKILGLTESELCGRTSIDPRWRCVHENGDEFLGSTHPAMKCLATGITQRDVTMGVHLTNGKINWININSQLIDPKAKPDERVVVSLFTNITLQKQNQAALIQSAKMTSLGEMAAGIAHEINTPLAVIVASTDYLRVVLESNPINNIAAMAKVGKIEQTGMRIASIVRGLKTFARDSQSDPKQVVTLESIITDTIALCGERFKSHGIDLSYSCSPSLKIECVPTGLAQILLNLLNNAFDAAANTTNPWVKLNAFENGGLLKIEVMDSGAGIDSKVKERLMTPFFTTKPIGKGTGLGLSISKGIAEGMNGKLFCDSTQTNTTFVLELPVYAEGKKDSCNAKVA